MFLHFLFSGQSSGSASGGGFASKSASATNGYALGKSASSSSLQESADNMLKDLEGSLKASTNYIESHRSYTGPEGSQEYHEVRQYNSGGGVPGSRQPDDFDLERQVQHMMPPGATSSMLNGSSASASSQLQSTGMVSSVQQQKQSSYTTYKVQTNQYGGAGDRIEYQPQQQGSRPGSRLKQNIDELDTLLDDLNNARKVSSDVSGGDYTAASSEAQRSALATAAEGLMAASNAVNAAGVLTALGILVVSLVMRGGVFPKGVAYLGVATGAAGVVCEVLRDALGAGYFVYGTLLPVWFLAVGWTFYRLARGPNDGVAASPARGRGRYGQP